MTDDQRRILIAGGGPVGLLCAWLIGRHGLPVRVFDNNSTLQMDLRAATTHPATLDLLDDALVGDMARVGLVAPIFQFWDRPNQAWLRSSITPFSKTTRGIHSSCNANSSRLQSWFWTGCGFIRMSRRCSIMKSSTWRRAATP
jgi:2-polyprenyl-6-methoxyphenol hydroxylase-like FAD-dependent oxidoreductase